MILKRQKEEVNRQMQIRVGGPIAGSGRLPSELEEWPEEGPQGPWREQVALGMYGVR